MGDGAGWIEARVSEWESHSVASSSSAKRVAARRLDQCGLDGRISGAARTLRDSSGNSSGLSPLSGSSSTPASPKLNASSSLLAKTMPTDSAESRRAMNPSTSSDSGQGAGALSTTHRIGAPPRP